MIGLPAVKRFLRLVKVGGRNVVIVVEGPLVSWHGATKVVNSVIMVLQGVLVVKETTELHRV